MPDKDYRLQVFAFGDDATGSVDFTVGTLSSHTLPLVGKIPEVSAGMIRPLEGDVDPISFDVRVADESGDLTSRLSDNTGRLDVMNRTVRWAFSTDGGSNWSTLFTGRLRSVRQENPAVYKLQVTNERFVEAEHEVFTAEQLADSAFPFEATTTVVPEGVRPDLERVHRGQVATPLPHWTVLEDVGDGVWKMQAETRGNQHPHPTEVSEMAASVIRDDVADQTKWPSQNFEHLQFREVTRSGSKPWSGTDRDVVGFAGFEHTGTGDTPASGQTMDPVAGLREEKDRARTVYARLDSPSVGDELRGFLYMPDKPPTDRVPVHIGAQSSSADIWRVDPMWVVQQLYDYFDVAYDSDAFTAWDASTDPQAILQNPHIVGRGDFWLRVTGTWNLRELTTAIYKSYGVVPFTGAGEIAPKRVMLPQEQAVSDPSNLFTFRAEATSSDEANIASDMPVWAHTSREQVTRVVGEWTRIGLLPWQRLPGFTQTALQEPTEVEELAGLDVVTTEGRQEVVDHDRIDSFGTRAHDVQLIGQHTTISAKEAIEALAGDVLDRYGDGPVEVEIPVVEGAEDANGDSPEDLDPGDWVLVKHEALPNPETGDRTGDRMMQVMDLRQTFGGLRVHLLDAGPNQQPNTAPSVSLAKDSSNPFRGVEATVSGLDSGTEKWVLWLAVASSEPDANSEEWFVADRVDAGTNSVTYSPLPSGNTIWARVQAWERGRTRSGFSTVDSATLDSYTTPTNLSVDTSLSDAARVSWDAGVDTLPTEVRLDRGNGLVKEQVKPAGMENAFLFDLDAGTLYTVGVRHIDTNEDPPGTSGEATLDFTTASAGSEDDPDDGSNGGNPGEPTQPNSPTEKFE